MKNIIFKSASLSLLLMSATMTGCYEDNGNYDYIDLDEMSVSNPDGVPSGDYDHFDLSLGDNIYINPEVLFNGKPVQSESDAPLSYMWTIYPANAGLGVTNFTDTLSTSKVLDVPIKQAGGNYYVQLTVTNKNTGLEAYYRATCMVNVSMTAGWMMIYEPADKPGTTDAGLVINPLSKKAIQAQNKKEFWNLISTNNGGEPLQGKPVVIFHEDMPLASNGTIRVASEKTIIACSPTDFSTIFTQDQFFYDNQNFENIQFWGPTARMNMYAEGLIADNRLKTLSGNSGNAQAYFGVTKISDDDLGELAPWISSRPMGASEAVFYSQTKGAFYYTISNNANIFAFAPQDMSVCPFDVNNLDGARMLFADYSVGMAIPQNYDYFLFGKGDKRFIAEANFTSGVNPYLALTWEDISDSPEIQNATTFAVNTTGRYAYYGAGNKVYNVAYESHNTEVAWQAPDANEVVTCVRTQKNYYMMMQMAMVQNPGMVVHIATWNEATRTGKLYEYMINPASGKIMTEGEQYEYVVPGKVKDMCWKFAMGG